MFQEAVLAIEWRASAEFSGAAPIRQVLVAENLDWLLGLRNLDRMRCKIGEHMCVALESVGPRSAAPCAGGEVGIDEGPSIGRIAADGDAGRAAVRGREHTIWKHHGERAEAAIGHP